MESLLIDKEYKQIYDSVHGYIKISDIACKIIDTKQFQRLRNLHQLGTCYYVFPNATHTRFEHSIGTYYLTGRILDCIKTNSPADKLEEWLRQIPELENYYARTYNNSNKWPLDNYVCELIKIAGLCHDIGHGPFSHVFDDWFITSKFNSQTNNNKMVSHEQRSCDIVENIIKSSDLQNIIFEDDIKFIQKLINPPKQEQSFVYQIVSNNLNSIDVDKFDYIVRDTYSVGLRYSIDFSKMVDDVKVIDNKICYPEKIVYEIISLFLTRYRLHKQIYNHKAVISIQFMICDIMKLIDPIMQISDSINNLDSFCDLTDDYILSFVKMAHGNKQLLSLKDDQCNKLDKAVLILDRINNRRLYKFICSFVSSHNSGITQEIIERKLKQNGCQIALDDILVYSTKIGFVSGNNKNPLDNIYFYNSKNSDECYLIKKESTTFLLTDTYQEYITMIFIRKEIDEDIDKITKILEDL